MPTIGVTGHVKLSDGSAELVFDALVAELRTHAGAAVHGITCLAGGADQIFAQAVLALGGSFDVVLPADNYRAELSGAQQRAFDELLDKADRVRTLPYAAPDRAAYLAASEAMLDESECLIAVWDGLPSQNVGDTGHVVSTARKRGIPVFRCWPTGVSRA